MFGRIVLLVAVAALFCAANGEVAGAAESGAPDFASVREIAEQAVRAAAEKAVKEAVERAASETAQKLVDAKADEAKRETRAKEAKEEARERLNQIDTRIFRLENASAEEIAEKLNEMWNGEFGQVWKIKKIAVPFQESNSIIVTAPRVILSACENVIAGLDVESQQVYIEARFIELGNTASHKVGIDWSMLDGMTGSATLGGGIQSYNVGSGVENYSRELSSKTDGKTSYTLVGGRSTSSAGTFLGSKDGSISYFNGTLNYSQMSLTLKALDATEDARTFSNPKIIVSSGKKAIVDMTTKYPNVKIAAKRTTGTSDSVDIAANIEAIPGEDKMMFAKEAFFSWGISLDVTPRVSSNGLINVSIVPTISSCTDWVTASAGDTSTTANNAGTYSSKYPVLDVQRLVTDFTLAAGETAVIGGLSKTTEEQTDTGIPLLRDIPWIGDKLFGRKIRTKVQKEILVFVTVGMADPKRVPMDIGLPKNAVLGRMYTEGVKFEPGDRHGNAIEGIASLDTRSLEEQAKDPLATNKTERMVFPMPFIKAKDGTNSDAKPQNEK